METDIKTKPSEFSMGVAARAFCTPETEHIVMIPELAEAFASIIEDYREALMWCGGSVDFAPNGIASEGWEKICKPLISNG